MADKLHLLCLWILNASSYTVLSDVLIAIRVVKSFKTVRLEFKYKLLHEYRYLRYFRDLRNGKIITEGKAWGDYCAIPKVSKEGRYPYSCNNTLFRLWLEASFVTTGRHH